MKQWDSGTVSIPGHSSHIWRLSAAPKISFDKVSPCHTRHEGQFVPNSWWDENSAAVRASEGSVIVAWSPHSITLTSHSRCLPSPGPCVSQQSYEYEYLSRRWLLDTHFSGCQPHTNIFKESSTTSAFSKSQFSSFWQIYTSRHLDRGSAKLFKNQLLVSHYYFVF